MGGCQSTFRNLLWLSPQFPSAMIWCPTVWWPSLGYTLLILKLSPVIATEGILLVRWSLCSLSVCLSICDHLLKVCEHVVLQIAYGISPNLQLHCTWGTARGDKEELVGCWDQTVGGRQQDEMQSKITCLKCTFLVKAYRLFDVKHRLVYNVFIQTIKRAKIKRWCCLQAQATYNHFCS